MGCDFPIMAYRSPEKTTSGKRAITFNPVKSVNSANPFGLPCGKCTGCRLDRAREWAIRCVHESKLHQDNAFITLTYRDEHLPADYSVDVREWQLFMKKLRDHVAQREPSRRLRFFACGEYGDLNLRPHYHALIFNYSFPDKKPYSKSKTGTPLYTSPLLEQLWPYGFNTVGSVTHQSAGYTARYTMKKIGGDKAADHYTRVHPITGATVQVRPEFATQSRRPGLGQGFVDKYRADFYPSDYLIVDGRKVPVPKFYLKQLTEAEQEELKRARRARALVYKEHNTNRRRVARVTVRDARISGLTRTLKEN